jgi:hypothetical protein
MSRMVCLRCNQVGEPKSFTPGSLAIEVVLWCCFLLPGVIYSLWRHSKRHDVCPTCQHADLVPEASPRGRQIAGIPAPGQQQESVAIPRAGAVGLGRALGGAVRKITGK